MPTHPHQHRWVSDACNLASSVNHGNQLACLLAKHGELMTTDHLQAFLGFKDRRGLTRAAARGAVPFFTFVVPGRKGVHARTRDVANWLAHAGNRTCQ